ncbi:MAG TPA: succinate dehydrogenase, cytochrome b556 subunit [Steroidobacteraceae bacterium]|jgi:succinate dehydrogenase / fumarate reductase cytochrome b subunit|nr:succinate dehydrogenase, cytochrome b556 subunit [Steroidobacteraceae bacterium]
MQPDLRPISPALQIYRPQLTSVLSITHRLTGVLLSLGAVVLVGWIAAAAAGPQAYGALTKVIGSAWGRVAMFMWVFSLFFHLCNGIRHLMWDAGYGFDLHAIYTSGWMVVVASALLSIVVWFLGMSFVVR